MTDTRPCHCGRGPCRPNQNNCQECNYEGQIRYKANIIRLPVERLSGTFHCGVKKLCWVAGCFKPVYGNIHFCEIHEYKPPANVAKLTGARA